jgi:hypothetical protein
MPVVFGPLPQECIGALDLHTKDVRPIANITADCVAFPTEIQETVNNEQFPLILLRTLYQRAELHFSRKGL